jgi:hypothetical protein
MTSEEIIEKAKLMQQGQAGIPVKPDRKSTLEMKDRVTARVTLHHETFGTDPVSFDHGGDTLIPGGTESILRKSVRLTNTMWTPLHLAGCLICISNKKPDYTWPAGQESGVVRVRFKGEQKHVFIIRIGMPQVLELVDGLDLEVQAVSGFALLSICGVPIRE